MSHGIKTCRIINKLLKKSCGLIGRENVQKSVRVRKGEVFNLERNRDLVEEVN